MTRRTRVKVFRLSRDTVLFVAGLIGIGYEAFGRSVERPTLLLLYAAMVGLPAFLRSDEARKETKAEEAAKEEAARET